MPKNHLNLSLDQDLAEFAKVFASENRITVSDMVTQYLLALKRRVEGEQVEEILAHPVFYKAMSDVQVKLQKGTGQWHTYDEVFKD